MLIFSKHRDVKKVVVAMTVLAEMKTKAAAVLEALEDVKNMAVNALKVLVVAIKNLKVLQAILVTHADQKPLAVSMHHVDQKVVVTALEVQAEAMVQ